MAVVRGDHRYSLPEKSGMLRRPSGPLATEWVSLIQSARKNDLSHIEGLERDVAALLSILWNFDPTPDPEAILNLGWKQPARVPLDAHITPHLVAHFWLCFGPARRRCPDRN